VCVDLALYRNWPNRIQILSHRLLSCAFSYLFLFFLLLFLLFLFLLLFFLLFLFLDLRGRVLSAVLLVFGGVGLAGLLAGALAEPLGQLA